MSLKDRLKRAREARGYATQGELAARVGCGQSAIGNIEAGQESSKWIPRIAWVLGVPAAWLTEEDYNGPDPLTEDAATDNLVAFEGARDSVIRAAIEVMEKLDARGRLECFAAVRSAADRYALVRAPKASGE